MGIVYEIQVNDTGCGMTEEETQRIQISFDKLSSDTTYTRSAGIGLSACRDLIRKLGGRLHVKSQLKRGTSFTITLQTYCLMSKAEIDEYYKSQVKQDLDIQ